MKKKKLNLKTLLTVLLIAYFAVIFIKQEFASARLNKEIQNANTQLKAIKEQGEQLTEQLELSKTNPERFGEKQARERLGYVKENETPVRPVP